MSFPRNLSLTMIKERESSKINNLWIPNEVYPDEDRGRNDRKVQKSSKKEVRAYLTEIGWKPKEPVGLPTLIGTYPTKVSVESVIH